MRIETVPAAQLNADQLLVWSRLQCADTRFDSPYFRPEFSQAVASVCNNVEVAILEKNNEIVGFFPYQRAKGNAGMPVGGKLSDFQGVIARKGIHIDPEGLIKKYGLSSWRFDHLICQQETFQPYHWSTAESPYMDLSGGWEAYKIWQLAEHRNSFAGITAKSRRAEREAGKITFVFHSGEREIFSTLIDWKRDQYRNKGVADVLACPWTIELLKNVLNHVCEPFSGVMSALFIGDIPAAVLLGMKSHDVLHSWFPAYNRLFARFSPGLILWLELAKAAQAHGIRRIDLGKGPEDYKRNIMSGSMPVAEGSVDTRPLAQGIMKSWHRACNWIRNTPLYKPFIIPGRFVRRMIESKILR